MGVKITESDRRTESEEIKKLGWDREIIKGERGKKKKKIFI
jgi:hypothetical protein